MIRQTTRTFSVDERLMESQYIKFAPRDLYTAVKPQTVAASYDAGSGSFDFGLFTHSSSVDYENLESFWKNDDFKG